VLVLDDAERRDGEEVDLWTARSSERWGKEANEDNRMKP